MKKRRRGHYRANKFDLPRATHQYNNKGEGTRVDPIAQNVAVIEKNMQGHYQANVVIDPTTGTSILYRHIIKGPTKSIWENSSNQGQTPSSSSPREKCRQVEQ